MRKPLLYFASALILLPALWAFASRPAVSLLAAFDILSDRGGPLAWIHPEVKKEGVRIPVGGRTLEADFYRRSGPGGSIKRPGLLLIHGLAEAGKDDPKLVRFARTMARAGFAVLVPDFTGLKSFRVRRDSVGEVAAAFDHLAAKTPGVRPGKNGILGISFGGGIGLLAAADAGIRERVAYVVSFGGYYDLSNVIRYYTTGGYAYGPERGIGNPVPWAKWYLILKNPDFLEDPADRTVFDAMARRKLREETADVSGWVKRLSPRGRALYDVLAERDFSRFPPLYAKVSPRVRDLLRALSLPEKIRDVKAEVILSHGIPDPLIPHTETLRLADALKGRGGAGGPDVSVTLLRLFRHVDPAGPAGTESLGWLEKVQEGWKFFRLVDRIRARAGL